MPVAISPSSCGNFLTRKSVLFDERRNVLYFHPHEYRFPPFLLSWDTRATGYQVSVRRLVLFGSKSSPVFASKSYHLQLTHECGRV
jgi:hypothetical protein